ncbi:helix-turn-helix domain-containing protein [Chryseobacterium sp. KMC2]|uniref:helix-turn-helix domain-containing protein n=1 Tax=Chryseobacterium sp. KMC2 TaxID=2800705 RepID=UPI0019245C95|nr:helix-turn-helix domain-containing protein [Chryseobacterium sp. KMC2]MBL3547296.1 helix-turn-helix domain-containing protein [Chryseobacterium sp. KMC2]
MKKKTIPNYKLIFLDILEEKFPEKKESCMSLLNKKEISQLDVMALKKKIFGNTDPSKDNLSQKHRAYNKKDILEILSYQKENRLSIVQTASHFKMSRNTISKWKKHYKIL